MRTALTLTALVYIAYTMLHIQRRPGLFAGVAMTSYVFSIYLGSIGPLIGSICLISAVAEIVTRLKPRLSYPEIFLFGWLSFSLITVLASWHIDIAATYGASLVLLTASSFLYGRAFGSRPGFIPDLILSACAAVVICEPGILITPSATFSRLTADLSPVGASVMADIPIVGCIAVLMLSTSHTAFQKFLVASFLLFVMIPVSITLGTRGVFLGAGAAFLVLLAIRLKQGRLLNLAGGIVATVALCAAGAIAALQFIPTEYSQIATRAAERVVSNFASNGQVVADTSSLMRLQTWQLSIDIFTSSPVYGHSVGAFQYLASGLDTPYPHNMFLEVLVNTGLIGAALLLIGLMPLTWAGLTRGYAQSAEWHYGFVAACTVDALVRMQLSLSIAHGKVLFLLLGVAAAHLAIHTAQNTRRLQSFPSQ